MLKCERCGTGIDNGEERMLNEQVMCEDCYMDALSPARTCDPWAVHSAKSLERCMGQAPQLTAMQAKILSVLDETGGMEPKDLCERLQLKPSDLEKEIAALRHMEKVRGELREGRKYIRLW